MPRLFLAVEIPEKIKSNFKGDINKFKPIITGKFVKPRNIHITLKFLGDVDPKEVHKLVEHLEDIKSKRFDCELKGTGIFPNTRVPRVLWVGIGVGFSNIVDLVKSLDSKLNSLDFKPDDKFHPHATFCRIKKVKLAALTDLLGNYKTHSFGFFEVKEFILMESILTPQGPIYLPKKKFALQ